MKGKLPKRIKSRKIGIKTQELFRHTFSEFCSVIPIPQEEDLGLDFDCQLIIEDSPTGIHFKIQCKGKSDVTTDNKVLQVPIKTKTVNYWNLEKDSVFLIIVDDTEKQFYWLDAKGFISNLNKNWRKQKYITFKIPLSQKFDIKIDKLPKKFEKVILETELKYKRGLKSAYIFRNEKKVIKELKILEDKLWFDRHQMIKDLVKKKKTKIDSEIWKGALKAERKIRKRYSNKNLGPWTDLEWGMINGKISALRWLFGDEWDTLDS